MLQLEISYIIKALMHNIILSLTKKLEAIGRKILFLILTIIGAFANAADPIVSNLTAVQRPGTKLVDITYDLTADTPTVGITLRISSDGGLTFNVPVNTLTGAVGSNVPVGTGKVITWNAGIDWLGNYSNSMRFEVTPKNGEFTVPEGFADVATGNFVAVGPTEFPDDPWPGVKSIERFFMGKTEVTWSTWQDVRNWAAANGYDIGNSGAGTGTNRPVANVGWHDTLKWCNAYSEKTGLSPVYKLGNVIYRAGISSPTVDATADGYRLPSEKEWEFAARGGVKTNGYAYSGSDDIDEVAWHGAIFQTGQLKDVATKSANELGIFDMSGNVFEWVFDYGNEDWHGDKRPLFRGGSWNSHSFMCGVSDRFFAYPAWSVGYSFDIGLRVARSVAPPPPPTISTDLIVNTSYKVLVSIATNNGSITGQGNYDIDAPAIITATPVLGYRFTGWTGDASGTTNPLTITMNTDKSVGATFERDLNDADADGLTAYDESVIYGTNPTMADSDSDGLNDGWELGIGRFSIVSGSFTWPQARTDARSKGGDLACFPTEDRWNRALQNLGVSPFEEFTGLWIGASDAVVDGTWTWVSGEAFSFAPWGTGRPSNTSGNSLDYAEVSGGGGAEIGKWYDRSPTTIRDGYLLETGYATSPTVADADGDGLNDGQEQTAGTNPSIADTDGDGLNDGQEVNRTKTNPRLVDSDANGVNDANSDQDSDGLSNLAELSIYGTDPIKADTDGDGLTDSFELGLGRFTLVQSRLTWSQASAAAIAAGGHLATFPNEVEYARMKSEIGEGALDLIDGAWVGLSDSAVEGTWRWTTSEPNGFVIPWGTGRPSGLVGNSLDFAEISGGEGAEPWKWYDRSSTSLRDAYILERGYPTNPLLADTDEDGLSDGQESSAGSVPTLADTDGDGWGDGAEIEFGGFVRDSTKGAEFRIQLTPVSGQAQMEIKFPAAHGFSHIIETSSDLNNWQVFGAPVIGAGGVVKVLCSSENQNTRFFRVKRN